MRVSLAILGVAGVALVVRRLLMMTVAAWRKSVAEVGVVYGTAPFLWSMLQPGEGAGKVPVRASLVLLQDLVTMGPIQIGGNLLASAALGFLAPMRFTGLVCVPRILALAAGCSALVETAHYGLRLNRVLSMDDVLVNSVGAVRSGWRLAAGGAPRQRCSRTDLAGTGKMSRVSHQRLPACAC